MAYAGLGASQRRARRRRRGAPVLHILGLRDDQQEDHGEPEGDSLGNSSTLQSPTSGDEKLSAAGATTRLRESIAGVGAPEIPDFLDQVVASGGRLWPAACQRT